MAIGDDKPGALQLCFDERVFQEDIGPVDAQTIGQAAQGFQKEGDFRGPVSKVNVNVGDLSGQEVLGQGRCAHQVDQVF